MGKYFGTDGFRGEANVDLKVTHAYKVGRYLGYYYGKDHRPTMVIGKDTRRSSYMFEYALVASGMESSSPSIYCSINSSTSASTLHPLPLIIFIPLS